MDSDLTLLINKLSQDITQSLRTNFSVFIEKNKANNEVINTLKALLVRLPEHIDLNKKYNKLAQDYDELLEKYNALKESKGNITINVNEQSSKIIKLKNANPEKTVDFDLKKCDLEKVVEEEVSEAEVSEAEEDEVNVKEESEQEEVSEAKEEEEEEEEDEEEEDEDLLAGVELEEGGAPPADG